MHDAEISYRRGYSQGASDVIEAVFPLLTEDARKHLQRWHAEDVWKWRHAHDHRLAPQEKLPGMTPRTKLHLR